jgi:hypothetical protein
MKAFMQPQNDPRLFLIPSYKVRELPHQKSVKLAGKIRNSRIDKFKLTDVLFQKGLGFSYSQIYCEVGSRSCWSYKDSGVALERGGRMALLSYVHF